jgi:hypothetical protein
MQTYAKYHYFGDRSKSRTNVITFATIKDNSTIKFAFACSHNTDRYNKKLGKIKSFGKLKSKTQSYEITIDTPKYGVINLYLAQFVLDNPKLFPKWAKTVIFNHNFKNEGQILNDNLD